MDAKFLIVASCLFVSAWGDKLFENPDKEVETIPRGVSPSPLPVLPGFQGGVGPNTDFLNIPNGAFPPGLPALPGGDRLPCSLLPFPVIGDPACAGYCMIKFKINGGYCDKGMCVCRS